MNIEKYRKKIDIYMTLTLTYFFIVSISFNYFSLYSKFENYIMFTVLMIIAVIAYYTNVTFSLIMTIVTDFIYSTYKLYLNFTQGESVEFAVYYWLVLIPITATIGSIIGKYISLNQDEVKRIERQNKELVMIDEETGIRNSNALFNEMPIYMSMSRRYNLPVNLMLVRFKYRDTLHKIIGEENFRNIFIKTSEKLNESLRTEDRKYILDEHTFVFIIIADKEGCEVVKDRLKSNIANMTIDKGSKIHRTVKIEVQIGYHGYDESINDPLEFLELTERELEYDT